MFVFTFLLHVKVENVVGDVEHCINLFDHVVAGLVTAHFEEEETRRPTSFEQFLGVRRVAGG